LTTAAPRRKGRYRRHLVAHLDSVNIGRARPNPYKSASSTGVDKQPQDGPVWVRDPGPKTTGRGSGLVGDFVGDTKHHGGSDQAVYAFSREDLDDWENRLDRQLPNGFFGENLTIRELDVNSARIGERWRVGDSVELIVTCPRIPCSTFRGWVGERQWLRVFTAAARPGAYLSIAAAGWIKAGDRIEVVHHPDHEVTLSLVFRALTTAPALLPELLPAGDDLIEELRHAAGAQ
jgi:MOSC domain-containing protein YiiM